MKQFCVVISCFNNEQTILPMLESLRNQDCDKSLYDIIIADNNSTDNTWNIINDFKIENTIKYRFNENLEAIKNWNRVFYLAQEYKYITNLHTDDTITPDHLSLLINTIGDKDCCFPQLKMSNGWTMIAPPNITIKEEIKLNQMPVICMIKKEVLDILGGYANNRHGFYDWDMWIRFLIKGFTYTSTQRFTYNYTVHGYGNLPFGEWAAMIQNQYKDYL